VKKALAILVVVLLTATQSFAWGNAGHEIVAYLAYQHLSAAAKAKADALVALNPCYSEWKTTVASLPAEQRSVGIFMLAATWPDKIKGGMHVPPYTCQPKMVFGSDGGKSAAGGFSKDVPPAGPEAAQNIGYTDTRRHQYWHFVDLPFSTDGTPLAAELHPNSVDQIKLFSAALKSNEPDALKSYDLVWLEHLMGDVHQPMHDTQRFTKSHPNGDAGGNFVPVCVAAGCTAELHGYWDGLPGVGNNVALTIKTAQALDTAANLPDPGSADAASWAADGQTLAKKWVYAAPISSDEPGSKVGVPDATYKKNAMAVVNSQLLLAGSRLRRVLEADLGK
jgi:hypothetical protein